MHPLTLEFLYSSVCRETQVHMLHSDKMSRFVKDEGLQLQIDGARVAECNRPGKSSDFISNGVSINRKYLTAFEKCGIFNLSICYPIYDWTDDDVFDYLVENDIPFSKEYIVNGEYDSWKSRKIHE
jgi:3'-phosphoadenosine 5'-phosphosulfate sulfotransferase (PAPS reductase)/FAD synthetase